MINNILKKMGIFKGLDKDELKEITDTPIKDKKHQTPHRKAFKKNAVHYADLLMLPNDDNYRYALVIVDSRTRYVDAEALKTKKAEDVLQALQKIYKRNYLDDVEYILHVDNGSEFKGKFSKYFKKEGVILRVARTSRHRQQSVVEHVNNVLGRMIMITQQRKELETGTENKEWVKLLPEFIKQYNEEMKKKQIKDEVFYKMKPKIKGVKDILEEGTKVRIQLDRPEDVRGKRLKGNFRAGDIRFSIKTYTIDGFLITPGQPIIYLVKEIPFTGFTRNQVKVVDDNEAKIDKITLDFD